MSSSTTVPTGSLPSVATAVGAGAEMTTIHSAFRRELRLAPALIGSVEHGDRLFVVGWAWRDLAGRITTPCASVFGRRCQRRGSALSRRSQCAV
jgi:hypothetical protein